MNKTRGRKSHANVPLSKVAKWKVQSQSFTNIMLKQSGSKWKLQSQNFTNMMLKENGLVEGTVPKFYKYDASAKWLKVEVAVPKFYKYDA